jgi:hypothetical protein
MNEDRLHLSSLIPIKLMLDILIDLSILSAEHPVVRSLTHLRIAQARPQKVPKNAMTDGHSILNTFNRATCDRLVFGLCLQIHSIENLAQGYHSVFDQRGVLVFPDVESTPRRKS